MDQVSSERLTKAQREIAAEMIETKGFTLDNDTTGDQLAAAAFLFDNGILFLSSDARKEVAAMLRQPHPPSGAAE